MSLFVAFALVVVNIIFVFVCVCVCVCNSCSFLKGFYFVFLLPHELGCTFAVPLFTLFLEERKMARNFLKDFHFLWSSSCCWIGR